MRWTGSGLKKRVLMSGAVLHLATSGMRLKMPSCYFRVEKPSNSLCMLIVIVVILVVIPLY